MSVKLKGLNKLKKVASRDPYGKAARVWPKGSPNPNNPKGAPYDKTMGLFRTVESGAKALGSLALLGYGASKLKKSYNRNKYIKTRGFDEVARVGGSEFRSLTPKEKEMAKYFYDRIAEYSPSVAADPVASWNQIRALINTPTSYGPQTIETLNKVESSERSKKFL